MDNDITQEELSERLQELLGNMQEIGELVADKDLNFMTNEFRIKYDFAEGIINELVNKIDNMEIRKDGEKENSCLDVRIYNVLNGNMLNPFFLVAGYNTYIETVKQMSDEDLSKEFCYMFAGASVRKILYSIHQTLNDT